jgi:hypothetical protein
VPPPGAAPASDAGASTPPGGSTASRPAAGTSRGSAAAPAVEDTHVAFVDVKLLAVVGKKTQDQDVVMTLAGGEIAFAPKKGGAALRTLPYKRLVKATYTHAKDPKWDISLNSPPPDLETHGGVFGISSARHWLTLQTNTEYLILRLTDEHWASILHTIETRTGVKVDRVDSSNK